MNPELQRNLWLEATPRRVAWVVVALILVLGAVGVVTGMGGEQARDVGRALGVAGAIIFVVAGLLWGSREAAQSVTEEIGQRTWEFQRLSALSPWQMTWGKLLGAPSVAWLAALVGLTFAAADRAVENGGGTALLFVVGAIALAVIFHAVAISSALIGVRKARAEGRLSTLRGSILGLLFLLIVAWTITGVLGIRTAEAVSVTEGGVIRWFGETFSRNGFIVVSLILFAAWAVSGAWRLMRLELQTRNGGWWWPAFLVFAAVWTAGLTETLAEGWLAAFAVFVAGSYASAFAEPADRIRLRQFAGAAPRGDTERTLTLMPAIVPALLLAVVAAIGLMTAGAGGDASQIGLGGNPREALNTLIARDVMPAWAVLAFLVRDLGVIAYFRFGARPRRGDFGAVVALVLLYVAGGALGSAFGEGIGAALFLPNPEQPVVSLISAALQAFLIWTLAVRRIAGPDRPANA